MQDETRSQNSAQGTSHGKTENGPRSGAPAPPAGLPCLKKNNCTKVGAFRSAFVAQENIRLYVQHYGAENIAVLTVTISGECLSSREFQKLWRKLIKLLKKLFPDGMWIRERQPRTGNWHAHAVVNVGWDVKTGFPFDQVKQRFYANVDSRLRALWKKIREAAESCGFGRTELLPLKASGPACARYLAKYLAKATGNDKLQGEERCRLFGVWGGVRFVRTPFSFVRSRIIRMRKAWLAAEFGITRNEGFKVMFGEHWWFHLGPALLEVILPLDYYKIRKDGVHDFDDIGFNAYLEDTGRYEGWPSLEDAALDSQFRLFHEVGKLLFGPDKKQAHAFAVSCIARREERAKESDPQGLLDFRRIEREA